jgi:hypothetical protein
MHAQKLCATNATYPTNREAGCLHGLYNAEPMIRLRTEPS